MNKKKATIISILVVVGIAALVVGGMYLYRKAQPVQESSSSHYDPTKPSSTLSADADKQEAQTTPDLSQDLDACHVTSGNQINAIFNLTTAQPANNRGIAHTPGGTAQSCVYSLDETNSSNNRITVIVTKYDTNNARAQALDAYTSFTAVGGIGDAAYFVTSDYQPIDPSDASSAYNIYDLIVFKDQQSIEFVANIPMNANPFTDDTARQTLSALAKQATLPN